MDPITVCTTTWPNCPQRIEYLDRTLTALRQHLTATDRDLGYVVSSEFASGPLVEQLRVVCARHHAALLMRQANSRPNLGAHLNLLHRQIATPLRMCVQDDWLLQRPLDIAPAAALLESSPSLLCVRYYTIFTQFTHRNGPWAEIDRMGPWPVADNPALVHRRWFSQLGTYVEGGDAGAHENAMAEAFRRSALRAVAPVEVADDGQHYFTHIGHISAFQEKRPT